MYNNIYYVIYCFLNKIIILKKKLSNVYFSLSLSLVVSSSKHAMKTTLFSTIFNQVLRLIPLKCASIFKTL